ncbi:MAG: cell division protein ZapA [Treponema sp.]|jgi:cell division protein ZapA (FtsZ GTPase activity inhibitor)|nr:cell division protein ZapA [Treponema sp.]
MATELSLDILGTSFSIMADEDEAYLREILSQYRTAIENTQSISGITNPLNVAVLTGFLLCDEINKMKIDREGESQELEKRTQNLIAKLDQALKSEELNTNGACSAGATSAFTDQTNNEDEDGKINTIDG